jgi:hypothetical protein
VDLITPRLTEHVIRFYRNKEPTTAQARETRLRRVEPILEFIERIGLQAGPIDETLDGSDTFEEFVGNQMDELEKLPESTLMFLQAVMTSFDNIGVANGDDRRSNVRARELYVKDGRVIIVGSP